MTTPKKHISVVEAIAALRAIDLRKARLLAVDVKGWRASEFSSEAEITRLCRLRLEAAERFEAFIERRQIASLSDHERFDDDGAPPR